MEVTEVARGRGRRAAVLDAGVDVVAKQGLRALTHRTVDAEAGVPVGTTSNSFRTREALVAAVTRHLADRSLAWKLPDPDERDDPEHAVIAMVGDHVRAIVTHESMAGLAWYRLALEASNLPAVRQVVVSARDHVVAEYARLLTACGSSDPRRHGGELRAMVGGLALRQFYDPTPDFDPGRAVEPLLRGMLNRSGREPSCTMPEPTPERGMGELPAASRKDRVLDTAVEVLAARGTKGLTHRTVDAAAGLPTGTTSNYLPTRARLVEAALTRVTDRGAAVRVERLGTPPATDAELMGRLVTILCGAADIWRNDLTAIMVLCYEAATTPAYAPSLVRAVQPWRDTFGSWLAGLGAPDEKFAGETLDSYILGLILAQYSTPDPDFDAPAAVTPMVIGLLG